MLLTPMELLDNQAQLVILPGSGRAAVRELPDVEELRTPFCTSEDFLGWLPTPFERMNEATCVW